MSAPVNPRILEAQRTSRFLGKRVRGRWRFVEKFDAKRGEIVWASRPAKAGAFFNDEHVAYLSHHFDLVVMTMKQALDACGGEL